MNLYSMLIISNRRDIVSLSLNKLICHLETQKSMKLRVLATAYQQLIRPDRRFQYSQQ